jgi:hypothetical protein
MSFLDKAREKLTEAVDKHGGKVADGIDKAAAAVDKRTGGKHHDKITGVTGKARDALDKRGGKDGDDLGPDRPETNTP